MLERRQRGGTELRCVQAQPGTKLRMNHRRQRRVHAGCVRPAHRGDIGAEGRLLRSTAKHTKRLEEFGYVTMTDTPQEFARFLHEDIEKMARLIKQYNLKPE